MIVCQRILLWAYCVCVFLPITIPWVVLGLGITCSLIIIIKDRKYTAPPLLAPILGLALVAFISGLVNNGFGDAFDSFIGLRALLVYFWAHHALSCLPGERKNVVLILLCMGALDGLWGSIQQIFNFHPFEKYKYLQASGFVRNPMAFAGEMQVTSCIALALALKNKAGELPINRILIICLAIANFMGVIFASERSAWLGISVAVLVIAFLVSRQLFFKTVLAGAALVTFMWFTVPVVSARLGPLISNFQNDTSARVRLSIWTECISMWQRSPMLGLGINHFPKLDYKEAVVPGVSDFLTHAHSNYFHILVTLGLCGLFAYLVLLANIFWLAYSNYKGALHIQTDLDKAIALGVLGALVSLSVAGIFEYNFGAGHVRLIQWFALAFLYSLSGPAQRSETHSGDDSR